MLTWMPKIWENVFNAGLAYSVVFLSITLITGMGGQLSLCQATLAGVGAFMAAQLASHFGLNFLVGGLVGAVAAAAVAVVLAFASVRLRGLGLALMTIAAALVFDNVVFAEVDTVARAADQRHAPCGRVSASSTRTARPTSSWPWWCWPCASSWCCGCGAARSAGSSGRCRGADGGRGDRGQPHLDARPGVRALGRGGRDRGDACSSINQQAVNPNTFSWEFSLVFVVVVVTTGRQHRRGRHPGRVRLRRAPAAAHLRARPPRRQQPADHLLRLRRPHLRGPPRGHPGVPEATLDAAVRAAAASADRTTPTSAAPRGSRGRHAGLASGPAVVADHGDPGRRCCGWTGCPSPSAGSPPSTTCRWRSGAGESVGPGRAERRRQDDPVQLRLRPAAPRAGTDRSRRPGPRPPAHLPSGPGWGSAAPTSGSRCSRT